MVEVWQFMDAYSRFQTWTLPKRRRSTRGRPALRLVALRMPSNDHLLTASAFDHLTAKLRDGVEAHIPRCHMENTAPGSSVFLLAQDSRRHGTARVHIQTVRPSGDHAAFAALCSALPHTQMITALELMGHSDALQLDGIVGAWLGYALFHPDTAATSSLTALCLCLPRFQSPVVDNLLRMATGNNLLVAMGVATIESSAYYGALLAARTHVYADAGATATILYTIPREQTVTLCIASIEALTDDQWVCVVVPGLGLGWVPGKQIGSVVARAPGISPLRRLELSVDREPQRDRESVAPQLLSLLGASLTHLKILSRIPTRDLRAVLHSCPHLQALRVHHDGECWSDPVAVLLMPPVPRLQTLELRLSRRLYPLIAPQLDDLTCLRVIDPARYHQLQLLRTLERYPRLSHVYWSSSNCQPLPWWETSGYRPWWKPTVGSHRRDWQSTSYGLLGDGVRGTLDQARVPLPPYARLAFLSIFSSGTTAGGLPRLSPDVVQLVFAFGTMSVPRQLLIRYDAEDPSD